MEEPRRALFPFWCAAALIVLTPMLYVASAGPAVWLMERGWVSEDSLEAAYKPLIRIAERAQLTDELDWYAGLFQ